MCQHVKAGALESHLGTSILTSFCYGYLSCRGGPKYPNLTGLQLSCRVLKKKQTDFNDFRYFPGYVACYEHSLPQPPHPRPHLLY